MNILIELQLETFKSDRTSQLTSSNSMLLGIYVPAQAGQNLVIGHLCQIDLTHLHKIKVVSNKNFFFFFNLTNKF